MDDKSHKKLFLRYFLSPDKVVDPKIMVFNKTLLEGNPHQQRCYVPEPAESVTLTSDLFLKSVGYRSLPIPGIPFDHRHAIVPNDKGSVTDENGEAIKGLYVCGWAKRGATGIIDATLRDSYETFRMIKYHLENGALESKENSAKNTILKLDK